MSLLHRPGPIPCLCFAALMAASVGVSAATLPEQNLWVELRWVQSQVTAAAMQGVREGATVVGTAGSVSPRSQTTLSSSGVDGPPAQPSSERLPSLLVLNGQTTSVQFSHWQTLQWLEGGLQIDTRDAGAAPAAASAASASGPRWRAGGQLRQLPVAQSHGFSITPQWPGGQRPVRVSLQVQQAGEAAQQPQSAQALPSSQLISTVLAPLGQWVTVARSANTAAAPQAGVISSQDARPRISRELQIRVDLAP